MSRLVFTALLLGGCSFTPGLDSDPAAWNPERLAVTAGDSGGAADAAALPVACNMDPPFVADMKTSSAKSLSHRSDQPCLEGCHVAGGTAKKTLAVGGTIHVSQTSREVATSGTVHGVGGTTLTVDRCGNIYATADALKGDPQLTEPFVQNPTLHRMDKSLYRIKNPGSCNQSSCHDFGSKLRWGIYF